MLDKIKEKKFALGLVGSGVASALMPVAVFAEGTGGTSNITSDMSTALTTGFSNVQSDVTSIITTALPYALVIMGIGLALTIGIRMFGKLAKRG